MDTWDVKLKSDAQPIPSLRLRMSRGHGTQDLNNHHMALRTTNRYRQVVRDQLEERKLPKTEFFCRKPQRN